LARLNPLLDVESVDSDQHPARANRLGVQVYNTAVVRAGDRRIEVVTTDEQEIALAILRAVRGSDKIVCFASGTASTTSTTSPFIRISKAPRATATSIEGMAIVQTQQHGLGRLRQMLEKLGLIARKVPLGGAGPVPADCAALVEANPRTAIQGPTRKSCAPIWSAAVAC
jgi:hypothetical protein